MSTTPSLFDEPASFLDDPEPTRPVDTSAPIEPRATVSPVAAKKSVNATSAKKVGRAHGLVAEGAEALTAGRVDRARDRFTQATEIEPALADAWAGLYACGDVDALIKVAEHSPRFGSTGVRIRVNVEIDEDTSPPLTAITAWVGVAARHAENADLDKARTILAGLAGEPEADYLAATLDDDHDRAAETLTRLANTNSSVSAGSGLRAADLHVGAGRTDRAASLLRRVASGAQAGAARAAQGRLAGLGQALPEAGVFSGGLGALAATARTATSGVTSAHQQAATESVDEALAELDAIIGQPGIKRQVRALLAQVQVGQEREAAGLKVGNLAAHLVFAGPPGTGKTTIARLIARLYFALGVLPSDKVIETDRSGLVGEHIGETARLTTAKIDEAMGGVLFIDEAYSLTPEDSPRDFGPEAIDTLLKRMEDDRGRFVVIAAGYSERMGRFLKSNPGLSSRFSKTIEFSAYEVEELVLIAQAMATAADHALAPDAEDLLRTRLTDEKGGGGFEAESWANARSVRNVIDQAAAARDTRIAGLGDTSIDSLMTLTVEDVTVACDDLNLGAKTLARETVEDVLAEFDRIIGQPAVKEQVRTLVAEVLAKKRRAELGLDVAGVAQHYVFTGPPGTAKTTVARLLARLLRAMDLSVTDKVVEVDRAGLVDTVIGGTEKKTAEAIEKARGGVLFVDEAYALVGEGNDFGGRASDTLLKAMEDQRNLAPQQQFTMIVAGYPDEMKRFVESNPGLPSRFTKTITFDSYEVEDLVEIVKVIAKGGHDTLADEAVERVRERLDAHAASGGLESRTWGNGRAARNIVETAARARDARLFEQPGAEPSRDDLTTLTAKDIDTACDSLTIGKAA